MKRLTYLVLLITFCGAQEVYSKPKYGPLAQPLHTEHRYLQKAEAPDYWSLAPYYTAQQDDRSCSVATAVMLLNALRKNQPLDSEAPLVTQKNLMSKVNISAWKRSVGPAGFGVTLEEMKHYLEKSFLIYGLNNIRLESSHATPGMRNMFLKYLKENEVSDRNFIIVNFLQGTLTGDTGGGHFAIIGAYDSHKNQVLIMDPDREWYEPYWVSVETLFKSMNTIDPSTSQTRGYLFISDTK